MGNTDSVRAEAAAGALGRVTNLEDRWLGDGSTVEKAVSQRKLPALTWTPLSFEGGVYWSSDFWVP